MFNKQRAVALTLFVILICGTAGHCKEVDSDIPLTVSLHVMGDVESLQSMRNRLREYRDIRVLEADTDALLYLHVIIIKDTDAEGNLIGYSGSYRAGSKTNLNFVLYELSRYLDPSKMNAIKSSLRDYEQPLGFFLYTDSSLDSLTKRITDSFNKGAGNKMRSFIQKHTQPE